MAEDFSKNMIEAEIAELSKKIEEKRRQLEGKSGIVEERELVKSAIVEHVGENTTPPLPVTSTASTQSSQSKAVAFDPSSGKSYLDYLDEDSRNRVTELVGIVFEKGISAGFKEALHDEPFVIDAFHDVLTDKVLNELKKRGLIK